MIIRTLGYNCVMEMLIKLKAVEVLGGAVAGSCRVSGTWSRDRRSWTVYTNHKMFWSPIYNHAILDTFCQVNEKLFPEGSAELTIEVTWNE